jgi:hypothetical protein
MPAMAKFLHCVHTAHAKAEIGGIFALRTHCALLLDYVPPEEPPSTPLGNALRIR